MAENKQQGWTGVAETSLVKEIQLVHSRDEVRLWRNNNGTAWNGAVDPRRPGCPGRGYTVTMKNARLVKFGLAPGSGDLIGFRSVTITPEMVGQKVAVFLSLEVKTKWGRIGPGQQEWCDMVKYLGGIAGFAKSSEEAGEIIYGENL